MKTIKDIKYYLRGKVYSKDVSPTNEYNQYGYSWRNALGIVADCNNDYPKVISIDSDIFYVKEEIEVLQEENNLEDLSYWQEKLDFLKRMESEGKHYRVVLSDYDEEDIDFCNENTWICALDCEDACRIALLELGYGEGELLYASAYDGTVLFEK